MVGGVERRAAVCLGLVSLFCAPLWGQGSADVQKVINQLNSAAAKFQSAQADFSWDQLTVAVQEHDVQTGAIYFERKKGLTEVMADIKQENGQDAPKKVLFNGSEAKFYEPKINHLTLIRAGANRAQWESFLTLGFGGSGTDLLANWKVSLLGMETMNGVQVAKLDLVPLQQKVLEMFPHVTIWIDPTQSISYQQIFYQPGGDKRTATYKNIRYNQPIAGDVFTIKTAPGTNRVVK
jgi:outer membrane lipoprotein-sorting protein